MIAGDKPQPANFIARAMPKRVGAQFCAQCFHHAVMRNFAQRKNRAQLFHRRNLSAEKRAASVDLCWQRLVLRRHTTHRIGDGAIHQTQSIIGALVVSALGQSMFQQGRVEKIARIIAGKWAARAVGPMQPRRKANDQQRRIGFAEHRHRRVEIIGQGARIGGAKIGQPRAKRAIVRRFAW